VQLFKLVSSTIVLLASMTFAADSGAQARRFDEVVIRPPTNYGALCASAGNCIVDDRVAGPIVEGAGTGGATIADKIRAAADAVESPCKPADMTDQQYSSMAMSICVAQTAANFTRMFGVTIGALGAIASQQHCAVKVSDKLSSGQTC
jgi:hypothetical protein